MDEREGAWHDEVESRVREAIARALEGTAQQILANGLQKPQAEKPAQRPPEGLNGTPADGQLTGRWPEPQPPSGPTRSQMLEVIGQHMAQGREHFARDGRSLETPEAVLDAMEQDGYIIVGERVTLPAGYQRT